MDNKNGHLGTEPVGKLMRGYSIPCIISLLVGVVALLLVEVFPPAAHRHLWRGLCPAAA